MASSPLSPVRFEVRTYAKILQYTKIFRDISPPLQANAETPS
jgi:hypothetical protein